MQEQWRLLGQDPASAPQDQDAEEEPEDFELLPDTWPAWVLFNDTWSQWRCIVGWERTHWLGVDLAALHAAMEMRCIPRRERAERLWQVQEMQTEARRFLNST